MPVHYHIIVGLSSPKALSDIMASIDKYTARRINKFLGRKGTLWQDGFYEHMVRDREDYDGILAYVHNNAVEAGLASSAELWNYSTANERYADEIDWEWLRPSLPRIAKSKYRFTRNRIPREYR